ncbi:MAG: O-antigen ligase family protein [Bryobacteraceae bacterium]
MLDTRLNALANPRIPREKIDFRAKFALFLLYGYYFLGKIFVYVSFPLVGLALFDRRMLVDRVYKSLTKPGPLNVPSWILLLSTIYGVGELIYGILAGNPRTTALEVFVFNVCPWFLFIGLHAGMQRPSLVRTYVHFIVWYQAIVTILHYLVLSHTEFIIGGTDWSELTAGTGTLAILGLICFERNLARYWFPLLVCSFNTIANQMRADWVGLAIAVTVWGVATKEMKRVCFVAGSIVALLAIGFILDVRLPAIAGRGGELSARDTVGRALSGIDPDLAREYSPSSSTYAGTISWRENWWKAIRETVFEGPVTTVFGLGYGYPIKDLVPYLRGFDIRTPHSVFYFTLAYSGLLGVLAFFSFQASLILVLWRVFRETGQIFGLIVLIYLISISLFGNFFEAPQMATPSYLLLGMCIGPLFRDHDQYPVAEDVRDSAPFTRAGAVPPQPVMRRRSPY